MIYFKNVRYLAASEMKSGNLRARSVNYVAYDYILMCGEKRHGNCSYRS